MDAVVYWTMVSVVGVIGVFLLILVAVGMSEHGWEKDDARQYLVALAIVPVAAFGWPVVIPGAVLGALLIGLTRLWQIAELPKPHLPRRKRRHADPEYIAQLERELGIR